MELRSGRSTGEVEDYQQGALDHAERTLYRTWDISYRRLQTENQDAAQLLKLLAYFDYQQLWHELFSTGLGQQSDIQIQFTRSLRIAWLSNRS